ncbi:hypothetical protein DO97_17845 [Neosynechococcus sphagnicola sy1]|uniref:DUF5132 domain-containing protein n=1 Tax=Neosynechococcus sphagnicola sy1 TaxID=1497020 RepID=A0A098THL7_9CYAN|nr:DUF5132 domain-containing protein [Neosynechococcus sphagnicola]KGF71531.1 hypothetical protein DO97_17845 [Neosynechococcus sphagnicola sy1]
MELEALLLGAEPLTALAIGIGSLALAPVLGAAHALSSSGQPTEILDKLQENARTAAKNGIAWGMDAVEKTQVFLAEAGESLQDLVAEAKIERSGKVQTSGAPQEVTIVTE